MSCLISIASSCSEDKDPLSHSIAQFSESTLSINESDKAQTISIKLDRPASLDGEIILNTNAPSAGCFFTEPASFQGQIKLSVFKGQSIAFLKMSPVDNNILDGCKIVKLNIASLSEGLVKGNTNEIAISVNDDEAPAAVTFEGDNVSVRENEELGIRINLNLSHPAPADGIFVVSLQSLSVYEQDYYTKPAAIAGKVFVQVTKGSTSAAVEVSPVNDSAVKEERNIRLSLIHATGGVSINTEEFLWCTITEDDGTHLLPVISTRF